MNNAYRYLSASLGALVITLSCFFLMQKLLSDPAEIVEVGPEYKITWGDVDFPEVPPPEPRRPIPEKPEETELPIVENTIAFNIPPLDSVIPTGKIDGVDVNLIKGNMAQPKELGRFSDLSVSVPIAPVYPSTARISGTEGWVKVKFTVQASGAVTNIEVLEASPRGVFDKATVAAVRKWRFNPRVVNGERVASQAVQVIEFNLDG